MYTFHNSSLKINYSLYLIRNGVKFQLAEKPGFIDELKKSLPAWAKAAGNAVLDAGWKVVDMTKSAATSGADWVEKRKKAIEWDIPFSAEDPNGGLLSATLEAQALKKAIQAVKLKKPDGTEYSGAEIDNMLMDGLQVGKNDIDIASRVMMQLNRSQQLALRAEIIKTNNAKFKNLYDTSTYAPPEEWVYRPQRVEMRFQKELWYSFREKWEELKNYFSNTVWLQNLQEGESANIRLLREQIVLRAKYTSQVIDNVLADAAKANGEFAKTKQIDWLWMTNKDSDLSEKLMEVTPDRDKKVQKEVLNYSGPRTGRDLIANLVAAAGDPEQTSVSVFGTNVPLPRDDETKRLEAIADILKNVHDGWAILDPTYAEQVGGAVAETARWIKNLFGMAAFVPGMLWTWLTADSIIISTGTWLAIAYGVHKWLPKLYLKPEDGSVKTVFKWGLLLPEVIRDTVWKFITSNKDIVRWFTPEAIERMKTGWEYLDPDSDTYKERIEAAKKEVRDLFKPIETRVLNPNPAGRAIISNPPTNLEQIELNRNSRVQSHPRTSAETAEMERRIERINTLDTEYRKAWINNDLNNLPNKKVIDYYLLEEVDGNKWVPRIENIVHIDDPDSRYQGAKRINTSDPLTKTARISPIRITPGTATTVIWKTLQAINPGRIEVWTPTEVVLKQAGKAVFGQRALDGAMTRMDLMTAGNTSEPFKLAATIKDAEGRHSVKPGEVNEYEVKDARLRQQVSALRVSASEFSQYLKANQLHQQLTALNNEYQIIQNELQGKDKKGNTIGEPIKQFQEEVITNAAGNNTTATRKVESPAYKEKMESLKQSRATISAKTQEIAKLPKELQTPAETQRFLLEAADKIDLALKQIETIKSIKLEFLGRDIDGNPKFIRTDMNFEPNAFLNKVTRVVGKFITKSIK
jgi:hypothetical protein